MARVKATCSDHGDIETSIGEFELVISKNTGHSMYRFKCPIGEEVVYVNSVVSEVAKIMIGSGCEVSYVEDPVIDIVSAPPITVDDQIDAHQLLHGEGAEFALQQFITQSR